MVNCLVSVMSYLSELGTKRRLARCAVANTPLNRFDGELRWAKCVAVYDCDTITIAMRIEGKVRQYKVRFFGIDAPEMRPSLKSPTRETEKAAAYAARDYLKSIIDQKIILVEFMPPSFEKFGRLLLTVYHKEPDYWDFFRTKIQYKARADNINEHVVEKGHAVKYDGGKKTPYEINHLVQPVVDRVV